METEIKCIIFDFGGVLLNLDEEKTWSAYQEILDPARIEDVWQQVFYPFERGEISEDAFFNRLQRRSKMVLDGDIYVRHWNAMLLDLPEQRLQFLEKLSDQYPLYLLSNTNITHLRKVQSMMHRTNQYQRFVSCFQQLFFSHELRMRKPELRIYEQVLSMIPFSAEDCLFIDDKEENTLAAKSKGFKVITHDSKADISEAIEKYLMEP
ncbi:MAG: HAD family phosphatase [Saprospiraceae bacterium]|nr:HAD family phosphatase [Saprospiraceae bacterium]